MQLEEVLNKRRSVRTFLPQKVAREQIDVLLDAAQKAPSSCNLQVTKYIVIDEEKVLKQLSAEVTSKFTYSPCSIVVVAPTHLGVERYATVMSAAMAVENLLLRAFDIGLAGICMVGFQEDHKIKRILSIPDDFEILMLVSIGYEDAGAPHSGPNRIAKNDIYSYNTFGTLKNFNTETKLSGHTIRSVIDYRRRISSVYLDRFRLNTFDNQYYEAVFKAFKNLIESKGNEYESLLDVMSYDGVFLSQLKNHGAITRFSKVIATDYLQENLPFLRNMFDCETATINLQNVIQYNSTVDVATCVFQIQHIPEFEHLSESVFNILRPDGVFFVAFVEEMWFKRFLKTLLKLWKKVRYGADFNVYDNNKFYKAGPAQHVSLSKAKALIQKGGFKIESTTAINAYIKRGVKIHVLVATKYS